MGLDKAWGQSGLAERVEESLRARTRAEPNVEQFIVDSVTASLALGREPSGVDAEQAARVRWLAEALQAFQTLSDRSLVGLGTEQFVSDIKLGKGLPPEQSEQQRLSDWLSETIKYLENFNPAAQNEDDLELCDLLEDSQPTLLADLVRRAAPRHNEFDHEHLERQVNKLRGLQARLPMLIETMRGSARRIRLASDELDAPPNASVSPTPHPVPQEAAVEGESIAVVARRLVERNLGNESWDEKTASQARATYRLFGRLMEEEQGVRMLAPLRQAHIEHFDNFLKSIHKSYGKSSRDAGRTIAELRAIASTKTSDERGLDIATRSRHMGFLSALLALGAETEDIDAKINPAAFSGKKKTRARYARSIPKPDAMAGFFHSPVFVGCQSVDDLDTAGPNVFHRAAYFGPMLAHYQGMRREEYCGLEIQDIVLNHGDHPYIHVCFNTTRRLKNEQSVRNLFLHPELIRLGFIDYVVALKSLGYTRVFPDLYSPYTKSPLGDRYYDELKPILVRLSVTPHQFRHFFNNELKQKRVSHEFREDMMGHLGRSETTERYCDPVLIELQREDLSKIELRTAHLEPKPIRLLSWVEAVKVAPWARADRAKKGAPTKEA